MNKFLNFTDSHIPKKWNRKNKVITDINICTIDNHFFVQVKEREWNKHRKNVKMGEENAKIRYWRISLTEAATF